MANALNRDIIDAFNLAAKLKAAKLDFSLDIKDMGDYFVIHLMREDGETDSITVFDRDVYIDQKENTSAANIRDSLTAINSLITQGIFIQFARYLIANICTHTTFRIYAKP